MEIPEGEVVVAAEHEVRTQGEVGNYPGFKIYLDGFDVFNLAQNFLQVCDHPGKVGFLPGSGC